jgi:hypothetical protein
VNRRLSTREAELYQQWIENGRRLRAVIDELRVVAGHAIDLILDEARGTGREGITAS